MEWKVSSASTCAQTAALIQADRFDLALLDINLPDGNGLALCKKILSCNAGTRILFLTANDRETDMLKGYAAGGYDYITKPFSLLVLCQKIAVILQCAGGRQNQPQIYDDGFLCIDFASHEASLDGDSVSLTSFAQQVWASPCFCFPAFSFFSRRISFCLRRAFCSP